MQLTQATPFVPCTDLVQQIWFYRDVLGFDELFRADDYAYLNRDKAAIRLVQVWDSVDLTHPERQNSFYIDVEDLDALYDELKTALDLLSDGRVRAPFNQDYGQREFHVADEDCTLVFFGEAV
mgnify:CR=1 FL=1